MLKNKSGFVGIGAYAGNQLLPFYKDGYPCLFANTANKKCKYTFGNNVHVILLKNKIKNGKLANYLLINGESKRYGNYGSLVAYLKSQKILNKKE